MVQFTEQAMRARFWEATAEADAIKAVSGKLREERDAEAAKDAPSTSRMADLAARIKAAENPEGQPSLFELENERAGLARALKGKTGKRPE